MTPHVMKRDGCKVPFKSERIKEAILRAAKAAEVDDADYCATVAAVVSEQMQGRNQVDIKVPFKSERIKEAILRAAKAAEVDDADYCATVAAVVSEQMQGRNQVDINEIQTAVENQLMSGPYKQLARAYIEYRHDRDIEREKRGRLNQEIRGLVEQTNSSLLNENANKDSKVIPTQRDLLAGIVAKHYARQHLLPRDVVQAHERGDIHYHDLDYSPFFPMFNCMLTVENQLMSGPYKQLARAYIEYRHDRDIEREKRGRLNQEIRGLVEQTNSSLLNENANKDSKVIPTQRDLLAGIVAKHYARQHLLPRDVVQAHERGDIHYHDLDYSPFFPMFNCMLIDLKGRLTQGFKMGTAEIEPPM